MAHNTFVNYEFLKSLKYLQGPYASGRDWAAIEKALAAEAEEKKEGEAALNEMFQVRILICDWSILVT